MRRRLSVGKSHGQEAESEDEDGIAPVGSGGSPGTALAPGRLSDDPGAASRAEDADGGRPQRRNCSAREVGGFTGRRGAFPRRGRRSCEVVSITVPWVEVTRPWASRDSGAGAGAGCLRHEVGHRDKDSGGECTSQEITHAGRHGVT